MHTQTKERGREGRLTIDGVLCPWIFASLVTTFIFPSLSTPGKNVLVASWMRTSASWANPVSEVGRDDVYESGGG